MTEKIPAEIINHPLVLIDFYADWCEPCKILDPILDEVKKRMGHGFSVYKINIDRATSLAGHYSIKSVPVLMLFKNGEPVWRMNGFMLADELIQEFRKFSVHRN
ncbi:MAG: conjugal transfer protein TraF [Bacteroidia bacterium]|nr:conjugal transfer protein TraF [Bacteroidia bacterium]MCZ2278435.1 conjugal transfer protein TraF [Bacteroidia bacterium]